MKLIGIFILLLLFMMTSSTQDRITKIKFEDGKNAKWGMYPNHVPKQPWKVRVVLMEDGQAREKGVQEGWKILSVNDEDITEKNLENLQKILNEETACMVTFEKSELNTLHQALLKDKPAAEEIKQIIEDFKTEKSEEWLTEKIIEEIDSVQWITTLNTLTEQPHPKDLNIFEIILNFLEKKPNELKEYIIKNEFVLHFLIHENDFTPALELLLNTLEKQGENIESYLLSDNFPLVDVFETDNEKLMDFVIQKISPKTLIDRVFNDPENLLKEFMKYHPIAFKKIVDITLEIGEQNALIKEIESKCELALDFEHNEDIYKIFSEKIYKGKEDEFIKYIQKENFLVIRMAFVTKQISAIAFYMNFLKEYDAKNGTRLLITELTKKGDDDTTPFLISTFNSNVLKLIEEIIPHETLKEILFDPEHSPTRHCYMKILIFHNNLDFLTKWFKIAEQDEKCKNHWLSILLIQDLLKTTIEKNLNEMSILILNFYENVYRNVIMLDQNFEKMLADKLMMSLEAKQFDVSLKLMQTMISLNCKVFGSPFKTNENIFYENLLSVMDTKLSKHDMKKGNQLTVENIKHFLEDKEQEKCAKKIKKQMQTEIEIFLHDQQQEMFTKTINKNEQELENFQIVMKAIVDHAKGLKALIQTIDFIKNRYTKNKKNGIYALKI
jgi:hypothetical protein